MFRSIQNLIEKTMAMIADHPFPCGFLTGLIAAFAILIFLLLICLVFRPRGLRYIVISSEGGELRIGAKAVQDAIRALADSFPAFDVRRISLGGKPSAVEFRIAMDFNGGSKPVTELAEQFRAAVARLAAETFGMGKPVRIHLEILRSLGDVPAIPAGVVSPESSGEETSDPGSGQTC